MYAKPERVREQQHMSRREALGRLAVLTAGLGWACTPLRIAFGLYPEEFDRQPERVERVLRAFVVTVVPGMPEGDRNLVRIYFDRYYPFAKYRNFFVSDLCQRGLEQYGTDAFDRLTFAQRTKVIQAGLEKGGVTRRLYTGAVFMAQVSCYAGIYDADRGCPLIDFEGNYSDRLPSGVSFDAPARYLARSISSDGNPV
jgi:hypothetical protein